MLIHTSLSRTTEVRVIALLELLVVPKRKLQTCNGF